MDLSIITVTWNSQSCIKKQIESVKKVADGLQYEQIVVDNNSSDKTVEIVKDIENVRMIVNSSNLGFGKANNLGLQVATGQFVLFLNPDMQLTNESSLFDMLKYLKNNPEIGVMSCKLISQTGQINRYDGPRRFLRLSNILVMIFKLHHLFPSLLNKYYYQDINLNKLQLVETVRGAFMLVRKDILDKLGKAFDERYFLWMEDVDFCRSVKKLGYKIAYNPSFSCIDLLGQSFKQEKFIKKQKMFYQSVIKYFRKWGLFN